MMFVLKRFTVHAETIARFVRIENGPLRRVKKDATLYRLDGDRQPPVSRYPVFHGGKLDIFKKNNRHFSELQLFFKVAECPQILGKFITAEIRYSLKIVEVFSSFFFYLKMASNPVNQLFLHHLSLWNKVNSYLYNLWNTGQKLTLKCFSIELGSGFKYCINLL